MDAFVDLESIYRHLEEKATTYEHASSISSLFQQLRDAKHKAGDLEVANKAQWEIDFFNFREEEGQLKSLFTSTNDKGAILEYPTLERFDEATFQYLAGRLEKTSNPLLRARYSHILWCSPKKHTMFAEVAVSSYLDLVKAYQQQDHLSPGRHYGMNVLHAVKNAYYVARSANCRLVEVKAEVLRLVKTSDFGSSYSFVLRADLIKLMLDQKRFFSKEDFQGLQDVCWQVLQSLVQNGNKSGNMHGAIAMAELGERVDAKIGRSSHDWTRVIAQSYESLMDEAEKQNNLASVDFCLLALKYHRRLKDSDKVAELEDKYSKIRASRKLGTISHEVDVTELVRRCRETAEEVVKTEPDQIIRFLMFDKTLLPKRVDVEKQVEEESREFPLLHVIPMSVVDQSGHPAEYFSTEEDKRYFHILRRYQLDIQLGGMFFIDAVLVAGVREKKLSAETTIDFLARNSWFGKNIRRMLPNGEAAEYNWLSLIAPSLHEYFLQINYALINSEYRPNLVLVIDSLTLKMEGLLRDICRFGKVTTFTATEDGKSSSTVREKDIHALLYDEQVKKLFDEDDLLFLRFLLVEQAGCNLRHRVAHSLMSFNEYQLPFAHLLILALLRLGKYDFADPKDNGESAT
jgi:hypothetical protein